MKERPVLFSAPMVRALLADTKTQTRRVVKMDRWRLANGGEVFAPPTICCPYGQPGDRLWVRETFMDLGACYLYRADSSAEQERAAAAPRQPWKPAIHMPRAASRIMLELTGVRVERLQDISQGDAIAEGAPPSHQSIDAISREYGYPDFPRSWYAQLWDSINGAGAWDSNPHVWVLEFRRI